MLRGTWRESAAELLGTFVLIVFGTASVAQKVLSEGGVGSALSIHLSWGLGVTMGVYVSAGVSGAHLNPAVTLALAAFRGFPWRKVVPYTLAQTAGAFAGAALTFLTYREAFDHFDGGARQVTGPLATAGIFATYPQPFLSTFPGGFVDQVVGTALLMLGIFALGDRKNAGPATLGPVLVGALVVSIGMTFGFNSGYAINPARDLGPRLFTLLAGWGSEVFRAGGGWWWVPVVAPCLGGLLGGFLYDLSITRHHPPERV
ncbi:MAG TPA: MIP family channel protein [Vicinamibacteria bacterium]|nr:MIP family channel protein [Vicinamibacteria bacterium]